MNDPEKKKVEIPSFILGIVHCSNENCISNNERGVQVILGL